MSHAGWLSSALHNIQRVGDILMDWIIEFLFCPQHGLITTLLNNLPAVIQWMNMAWYNLTIWKSERKSRNVF